VINDALACPKCRKHSLRVFTFPEGKGGWSECLWSGCGFTVYAVGCDPVAKWNEIADLVAAARGGAA
jgi:hypothetical protein